MPLLITLALHFIFRSGKPLHFKGSVFHRVIPGFMAQVRMLPEIIFENHFSVGYLFMQHVGNVNVSIQYFVRREGILHDRMEREVNRFMAKSLQMKILN